MEFYCVQCQRMVDVSPQEIIIQEGGERSFLHAPCPHCGMKINKFGEPKESRFSSF